MLASHGGDENDELLSSMREKRKVKNHTNQGTVDSAAEWLKKAEGDSKDTTIFAFSCYAGALKAPEGITMVAITIALTKEAT